uniref:tRNA-binding domain-containing protein n=1 Tax=Noctiluca scintillans TaxID=2966 RepID=A0A7S1AZJ7_NOCSC
MAQGFVSLPLKLRLHFRTDTKRAIVMLSPLLWLSPETTEFLKSIAQLLKGGAPCPKDRLVSLIRGDGSACEGFLGNANIREAFVAQLESSDLQEINESSARALVDVLAGTMRKNVDVVKEKATQVERALPPTDGTLPSFKEVTAKLGGTVSKTLQKDFLLWNAPACTHSPSDLSKPGEAITRQRIALAASVGEGVFADFVLRLHILENADEYLKWESSILANKPPPVSDRVRFPFTEQQSREVSARKVLSRVLSPEIAATAAPASVAGGLQQALEKLAEDARAASVIPAYEAPAAPKEPKQKKSKIGGDEPKVKEAAKKEAVTVEKQAAEKEAVKVEQQKGDAKKESIKKPDPKTTTPNEAAVGYGEELQWHYLAYHLSPVTSLSAPQEPKAPKTQGKSDVFASEKPKPQGFAGIWAPAGGAMPPGHTAYSWLHVPIAGISANSFVTTWSDKMPPGHTTDSLANVTPVSPPTASSPSTPVTKQPLFEKAAPAPKSDAVSPKDDTSASKSAPPAADGEDGLLTDLRKLDIRSGKIVECAPVEGSDKLYLLKVHIGQGEHRQVVSGLQKFYSVDQLQGRSVIVYCNIKPGKLCGLESQAMVLAGTAGDKGTDGEKCELLQPPSGSAEGLHPMCGDVEVGSLSAAQSVKQISKVWGRVQPSLRTTTAREMGFNGQALTIGGARVTIESLADAPVS